VVVAAGMDPSQKIRRSAARLCASARWRIAGVQGVGDQWAAREQRVSEAKACAAGRGPLSASPLEPKPAHREPRTGKPDAGDPPVRFGREGERIALLLSSSSFRGARRVKNSGSSFPVGRERQVEGPRLYLKAIGNEIRIRRAGRSRRIFWRRQGDRAASSSPSSPREERVGRGPRRGETNKNAPPLPSPLLHPMEERGKPSSLLQPCHGEHPVSPQ